MHDEALPILGSVVTLCRPAPADAEAITRLRSADSVRRWFVDDRPLDSERNKQWLFHQATSTTSGLLVIRSAIDGAFLGFVGWSDLDEAKGSVQLGRIAIERRAYLALARALGCVPRIADEIGHLVLSFAFEVLGVCQVYVETLVTNRAALDLCRRLGLKPTRTHQRQRPGGETVTLQVLELERSEWTALGGDLLHAKQIRGGQSGG